MTTPRPAPAVRRAPVEATDEERDLVARMRAGDARAFDEFADHYIPGLHRFASSRLGTERELTRDLVQATLCKAIERIDGWRGDAPLFTWLCACCRNEIAMHFRRSHSRPAMAPLDPESAANGGARFAGGGPGPEEQAIEREEGDLVHLALDRLPPRYASALEWKYLEDASVDEIAGRLGITPKAAESLLTRARGAFRTTYETLTNDRGIR